MNSMMRCSDCRHWESIGDPHIEGACQRITCAEIGEHGVKASMSVTTDGYEGAWGDFRTSADFGCTEWEDRVSAPDARAGKNPQQSGNPEGQD